MKIGSRTVMHWWEFRDVEWETRGWVVEIWSL